MAKIGSGKKDAPGAFGKATPAVQTDVESFLLSASLDRIADYVARGQSFKPLSDDELSDRWIEAFKAMADAPFDEPRRIVEEDLTSEFSFRKRQQPLGRVVDHSDRYIAAIDAALKAQRQEDSDGFLQSNKNLLEDIDNFKARRGNSS
jgi:hypothetical protein